MARSNRISLLKTTRANLNTQATANNLILGEPYLITDEARLAVGTGVNTYSAQAKQSEAFLPYGQAIGDGVSVSIVVTHNLGTQRVLGVLSRNSAPFDRLQCGVQATTVNTVTLTFSVAPTTNQYFISISKMV
jgi:hypothetical protein